MDHKIMYRISLIYSGGIMKRPLTRIFYLIFQYNHYFETTYGSGYNTVDTNKVPESLKHLEGK